MYDIVITGATGFIGKRVIAFMPKSVDKKRVLCLIWDTDSELEKEGRALIKKAGIAMKRVDIATGKGLADLPKAPKLILHLAATAETAKEDYRSNFPGTKNVIDALVPNKNTHIIYTSTTVFCSGRTDCTKPISETTSATPTNEYGRTKWEAEKWLVQDAKEKGYRLTVLRLNTVYGPNPRPNSMFKLLPEMIKEKSIAMRLDWPGKTALVYVDDVAKAIWQFAKKVPRSGNSEKYVLSAESISMAEISERLHQEMGISYKQMKVPHTAWVILRDMRKLIPAFEKLFPNDVYNTMWRASLLVDDVIWCNSQKAEKALGWRFKKLDEVAPLLSY